MKRRLPLYLAMTGAVAVMSGIGITVVLLVERVNCDSGTSPMTVCLGYTNSIHWAYPIVAIGVICFVAVGVSPSSGWVAAAEQTNLVEGDVGVADRLGRRWTSLERLPNTPVCLSQS